MDKGCCCFGYVQMQIKLLNFVEFQKCSLKITSADKISVIRWCALCDLHIIFRFVASFVCFRNTFVFALIVLFVCYTFDTIRHWCLSLSNLHAINECHREKKDAVVQFGAPMWAFVVVSIRLYCVSFGCRQCIIRSSEVRNFRVHIMGSNQNGKLTSRNDGERQRDGERGAKQQLNMELAQGPAY